MKLSTLIVCAVFVFGSALDSLAQFTPVVAKRRSVSYERQADGSEIEVHRTEGTYFRSSSGSVMETKFHLRDGRKQGASRSFYIDNSAGKSYSVDHSARKATVEQKLPTPLRLPSTRPTPDQVVGEAVINGLHCVAVPMITINGDTKTPIGKAWWSVDVYLAVKREYTMGGVRHVWELYDIQFADPDPSKLGFPSDYKVDPSKCSGCEESG